MKREIPADFNWVAERVRCTPTVMFEKLKLRVEEDIKTRMALMNPGESSRCNIAMVMANSASAFTVVMECRSIALHRASSFHLVEDGVQVRDERNSPVLTANLTLSNDGQCRFRVGEEELELWQLARLALEKVFFDISISSTGIGYADMTGI